MWTRVFAWCQWRLPTFHTPTSARCGLSFCSCILCSVDRNPIATNARNGRYPRFICSKYSIAGRSLFNPQGGVEDSRETSRKTRPRRLSPYDTPNIVSFCVLNDAGQLTNVSFCAAMKNMGVFNKLQALRLRGALASIQHVGTEGIDHAVVMAEDVVDVILR